MTEVVAIHNRPELIDACCALLNAEWPQNAAMRYNALRNSSDELPCSLVLLAGEVGEGRTVLGHLRLGLVLDISCAVCVKSVVIRKDSRRLGLGRLLMNAAEAHAKQLGYTTIYLSTIDQQEFYTRLGYAECEPVYFLTAGRNSRNAQLVAKLSKCELNEPKVHTPEKIQEDKLRPAGGTIVLAPPPPPPLPKRKPPQSRIAQESQTFMRKSL